MNIQSSLLMRDILTRVSCDEEDMRPGVNLIGTLNFASGWNFSGASADDADSFTASTAGGAYKTLSLAAGKWYVLSVGLAVSAGTVSVLLGTTGDSIVTAATTGGTVIFKFTAAGGSGDFYIKASEAATVDISHLVVREYNYSINNYLVNMVIPTMDRKGTMRKWYEFNGTSDKLVLADADLSVKLDFGVLDFSALVRVDISDKPVSSAVLLTKRAGSTAGWMLSIDSSGYLTLDFDDDVGTPVSTAFGTTDLSGEGDTLILVTFDRDGNATAYLDGVQEGTIAISGCPATITNNDDLAVFSTAAGADFAIGKFYGAAFFNYLMDVDQIAHYSDAAKHLYGEDATATNADVTSGTLTIGRRYQITVHAAGDFTNIGASANTAGTIFTATGTTPTNWGGDTLIELGCTLILHPEGFYADFVYDYYHALRFTVSGPVLEEMSLLRAFRFDGVDSYLKLVNADSPDLNGNLLVSFWMYLQGWGEAADGRIIDNSKLIIEVNDTNDCVRVSRDAATFAVSASNAIVLNRWIFCAITIARTGESSIWIGNQTTVPALSGAPNQAAGTPAAGTDIYVGNNSAGTKTFKGLLDGVEIRSFVDEDDLETLISLIYKTY